MSALTGAFMPRLLRSVAAIGVGARPAAFGPAYLKPEYQCLTPESDILRSRAANADSTVRLLLHRPDQHTHPVHPFPMVRHPSSM